MKKGEIGGTCSINSAHRTLVGRSEEKTRSGRPRSREKDKVKWVLQKQYMRVWTGFIWLRREANGELL